MSESVPTERRLKDQVIVVTGASSGIGRASARPSRPTTADDLDAPLPGDRGAHGSFDREARASSAQLWLRTHPGVVLLGAALALLVALVVTGELTRTVG